MTFGHFKKVGLNMNLENIVELGRPTFFEIFVRPLAWLLYSFLIQFFLQLVVLEKEYRKQNWGMNIVKIVKIEIVDKEVENFTSGR